MVGHIQIRVKPIPLQARTSVVALDFKNICSKFLRNKEERVSFKDRNWDGESVY